MAISFYLFLLNTLMLSMHCSTILLNFKFSLLKNHLYRHFTPMSSAKKALLVLSEGSEEMEAVITADVLRRAQINVTIAGLHTNNPIKCSRDVVIVPDKNLDDLDSNDFDALILPGGLKAANTFADSKTIGSILKNYEASGKLIAIICASPIALEKHGIGIDKNITSHPSVASQLTRFKYVKDRVVTSQNLITSQGPGTAFEFALAIVKKLIGEQKVQELSDSMILK